MLTLGPGLLAASGTRHKKQRKMLNPVFSAAHFRNITPTFLDVADRVRALIYALYAEPCNSPIIRSSSRLRSRHEYNTENKLSTSLVGWDALLLNLSVRGALGTRLTPSLQTTRRDTWKPSVNYRTYSDLSLQFCHIDTNVLQFCQLRDAAPTRDSPIPRLVRSRVVPSDAPRHHPQQ